MSTIPELEAQLQTHLTTNNGRNAPPSSSSYMTFLAEVHRLKNLIAAAKEREQRDKAVATTAALRISTGRELGPAERAVSEYAGLPVPPRPTGPIKTLFGTGRRRKRNHKRKTRKTRKTSRR